MTTRRFRSYRWLQPALFGLLLVGLCFSGCPANQETPTPHPDALSGPDAGDGDTSADAQPQLPDGDSLSPPTDDQTPEPDTSSPGTPTPGCSATDRGHCLYGQVRPYTVTELWGPTLTNSETGRPVPTYVRYPTEATGKLPVILWSHGGSDGSAKNKGSERWGTILAEAGYVVIALSHIPWTESGRSEVCAKLSMSQSACAEFKVLHYYRPLDIAAVIDQLDTIESNIAPLAGRLDRTRIAVIGHSAGSGGSMMVAGAARLFGDTPLTFSDPRPIAFVALSPQGPGIEGFFETSWTGVLRPMLVATGAGDSMPNGKTAENRSSSYDYLPAGDKYRLFIDHPDATHSVMNLGLESTPNFERLLSSAVLAYLDYYLKGNSTARAYLLSNDLAVASDGIAIWDRK